MIDIMKKLFLIAVAAMMMSAVQAQNSTADNLYNAGLLHYEKANYAKAVENFNEAAIQGNLKAMRNLAICYENGQGVEKNLPVALVWYEKAAKGGDEVSLRCVGNIYTYFPKAYGVKKDSVVSIMLPRTEMLSVSEFAILKAGGAFLGLLPDYPDDRIDYCLRDANCSTVITKKIQKWMMVAEQKRLIKYQYLMVRIMTLRIY